MHRLARSTSSSRAATLAAPGATSVLRSVHVLIADANPRSLAVRAEQLTAVGARLSIARTSFETIVKASCHLPDLILLDGSLAIDATVTSQLLTTCPATAHIPIVRLTPGKRLPQRLLDSALRSTS